MNLNELMGPTLYGRPVTVSPRATKRIERPHPMSSERTLAKVAGGRWFAKTVFEDEPACFQTKDGFIMHPKLFFELKEGLASAWAGNHFGQLFSAVSGLL